jgi:hypothetical protein
MRIAGDLGNDPIVVAVSVLGKPPHPGGMWGFCRPLVHRAALNCPDFQADDLSLAAGVTV